MSNRIFYASQGVAVGGSGGTTTVQGAQSVTMNTNYNLEQVFQLGRLEVYDNVVGDPSVEVGITKVLDGSPLIYTLACGSGSIQQTANVESAVTFAVGADTVENIGDNASSAVTSISCSPIYVQSLTYTFPVDGDFTEEVNFVGINKTVGSGTVASPSGGSDTTQTVLRRQNFKIAGLPAAVASGNVQSVTISADLGRESIYKLGQFKEFHRYVNFPLEISLEVEVLATELDEFEINVDNLGCSGLNLDKESVTIELCSPTDGGTVYSFDLGDKVSLTSVAFNGGDTGGGNATLTYSYIAYNTFTPAGPGSEALSAQAFVESQSVDVRPPADADADADLDW